MEIEMMSPQELGLSELNVKREHIDTAELENNIQQVGVLQPLVVRREKGEYRIVIGHRRWLAALSVGMRKVPCIVMDWDDEKAAIASLSENLDILRKNLEPIERGKVVIEIMKRFNWSQEELGKKLGIPQQTISDWIEPFREAYGEREREVLFRGEKVSPKKIITPVRGIDTAEKLRRSIESIGLKGEEVGKKMVEITEVAEKSGFTVSEIRRLAEEIKTSVAEVRKGEKRPDEVIEKAIEKIKARKKEGIKLFVEITFFGETAEALKRASEEEKVTPEEIVERAVINYLERKGYLGGGK